MLAPRRSRVDFSHKECFSVPKLVDQTLATNDDDNLPANSMEECNVKTLAALLVLSALGITVLRRRSHFYQVNINVFKTIRNGARLQGRIETSADVDRKTGLPPHVEQPKTDQLLGLDD
jgi:hypothetical protein